VEPSQFYSIIVIVCDQSNCFYFSESLTDWETRGVVVIVVVVVVVVVVVNLLRLCRSVSIELQARRSISLVTEPENGDRDDDDSAASGLVNL
jgi:hypothetical protein